MNTSTTTDKTVTFTEKALANIRQMGYRVGSIEAIYGKGSPQHVDAMATLIPSLITMLNLGGRVHGEDDLSLVGDAWITYGMIFHPDCDDTSIAGTWSVHS